jgi:16S rRNA (uracil1498-N3)-methyltransferase
MRLHRFYTTETIGLQKEITIHSAEMVNQIRRVFRLKSGDSIIIFDGSGSDYECHISDFGKESITLNVNSSSRSRFMPAREITLCAAVVKKDTFEWIVEKATELGVTKIIPVMTERSEKKNLNEARLKKIAIEASEQSGRGNIPTIHPIITLAEAMQRVVDKKITSVAFHTEGEKIQGLPLYSVIFIGPEGGWSPKEIALFHANNIDINCLGNQVLRAETAAIAALSLVMLG